MQYKYNITEKVINFGNVIKEDILQKWQKIYQPALRFFGSYEMKNISSGEQISSNRSVFQEETEAESDLFFFSFQKTHKVIMECV